MPRVLYVSHTGISEPLGFSQVFQYLAGLSRNHEIHLITYEKAAAQADAARMEELSEKCSSLGIQWHPLTWHNKPKLISTFGDIIAGFKLGKQVIRKQNIQIVHCRSYIGGLVGLALKKQTGIKFIFDMRGFWPDERVDGGIWKPNGLIYKLFKRAEKSLMLGADHIVSLTRSGVREIAKFDYIPQGTLSASVIPTCTDLKLFTSHEEKASSFTLGYVGSVGSWYLFNTVARIVARTFERFPDAQFLVINKGGHALIREELSRADVDLSRVKIEEVAYQKVPERIAMMSAGIFAVKPVWSKTASCPTRMAEFLACGKPIIANAGVGDVEEDICENNVGVVLHVDTDGNIDASQVDDAIDNLITLLEDNDLPNRCRTTAESKFSLEAGIKHYHAIYETLAADTVTR